MLKGSKKSRKPLYKKPLFIAAVSVLVIFIGVAFWYGAGRDTSVIPEEEMNYLYSNPDDYKGRMATMTGKVFNVQKDGDTTYIFMHRDIEGHDQETLIIDEFPDFAVDEGDYLYIEGNIDGRFEGENALGATVTCPQITATYLEQISITDAIKADKTVKVNKTINKNGYKVTIKKVDYVGDDLRIYISIKNDGNKEFTNYAESGKVIQDGKQYEAETLSIYPSPSMDVRAGASSEGVIEVKGVDKSNFKFEFEGFDADFHEMNYKFNINVK